MYINNRQWIGVSRSSQCKQSEPIKTVVARLRSNVQTSESIERRFGQVRALPSLCLGRESSIVNVFAKSYTESLSYRSLQRVIKDLEIGLFIVYNS